MIIDLRSDTVTRPSPAMRKAMADAEVGDDVYGEDPTVNAFEAEIAAALGKEAGLFTPSGTMANQIAVHLHAHASEEILVSEGAHLMLYESGAGPALSGVQFSTIGKGGGFDVADVVAAYKADNMHYAHTRAVFFENTHNRGGGRIFPQDEIVEIAATARKLGLSLHLDGARLWNAHVATGIPLTTLAAPFDTVSVCLSKGLGAPAGSVLTGGAEAMKRARRRRKMLGGGMRQAGILAAGARWAFKNNIARLADDHAACRAYAEGVASVPGVVLDPSTVQTNLCIFDLAPNVPLDAAAFVQRARDAGLLVNSVGPRRVRVVTHLDVDREACLRAAAITKQIVTSAR